MQKRYKSFFKKTKANTVKYLGIGVLFWIVSFSGFADVAFATVDPSYDRVKCMSSFMFNNEPVMVYPAVYAEGGSGFSWWYLGHQSNASISFIEQPDLSTFCDEEFVTTDWSTGGGGGGTTTSGTMFINTSDMNATSTCVSTATTAECVTVGYDYTLLFGLAFLITMAAAVIITMLLTKKS